MKIGEQWWMAENLKTARYRNRDVIGSTNPATKAIALESTPKYQWAYDGNENYVATYGRLYTWYTITDNRGVCPTGWHVSTDDDWTVLVNYLGVWNEIAGLLKESGNAHWFSPDISTNETGFTALPGGYRLDYNLVGGSYVGFDGLGSNGLWWTTTEYVGGDNWAWYRNMTYSDDYVDRGGYYKAVGMSIRCVKDPN